MITYSLTEAQARALLAKTQHDYDVLHSTPSVQWTQQDWCKGFGIKLLLDSYKRTVAQFERGER